MEFYMLDMSVRGSYSPFVVSYLKNHDLYPETEASDAEILKGSTCDFIGVNYYFSVCAKEKTSPVNHHQPPFWVSDLYDICANPYLEKTEWMDMGIDPEGLRTGMEKIYQRYQLPMIVTENGIATDDDTKRVQYIETALNGVLKCREEVLPIKGYLYWSFIDNWEWQSGYSMQFGLVSLDREKQIHTPKPSLAFLGFYTKK